MLHYRGDELYMEGVPLAEIAERVGTPVYVYSFGTLTQRVQAYKDAFPRALIAYAYKANATPALLAHLTQLGCGADVVSLGELQAALAVGVPPHNIVLNGNAKSDEELLLAAEVGVRSVNVDAREEIPRVIAAARRAGRPVSVKLRINPGIDAHTHGHLRVGAAGSHFGIPPEDVLAAARDVVRASVLRLHGIHIHLGSQLLDPQDMEAVARVAAHWVHVLRGEGFPVHEVDLGGGLGISYDGKPALSPQDVARIWTSHLASLDVRYVLEPGRWLVGPVGVLLVRVVQVKRAWSRTFVAVDGGMNVLLRPALYGARHRIWPLRRGTPVEQVDVVGPNCESSDVLGRDYILPRPQHGEVLAVLDVGAYGYSMANRYNLRELPMQVGVQGDAFFLLSVNWLPRQIYQGLDKSWSLPYNKGRIPQDTE